MVRFVTLKFFMCFVLIFYTAQSGHYYLNQCTLYASETSPQYREDVISGLSPLLNDIQFPNQLNKEAINSVHLWISSGGSRSNFHYDCSHNLLCVVCGTKRVRLLNPSYASLLKASPVFSNCPNHCRVCGRSSSHPPAYIHACTN